MRRLFVAAQDRVSCMTHAMGAVAALFGGAVFLCRAMAEKVSMLVLAAAMCFTFSLIALYTASALYHYYPGTADSTGIKRRLRKLDHSMIYVLIAGSYTPFAMVLLPQPKGMHFCVILWIVAAVGVIAKLAWLGAPRALSTALYLVMGWAVLFVIRDFAAVGASFMTLVVLGGVCYSVGAVFYICKRPNLSSEWTFHELFHLLILAGSAFHYLAVYLYVL